MLLAKAEHPVIKFDEHIKSHHALVPFSFAPHFIVLVPSPFLLTIAPDYPTLRSRPLGARA